MQTANTQQSSDDELPEPTLVCSSPSSPTAVEISVNIQRKIQISESEGDEVPVTTATD